MSAVNAQTSGRIVGSMLLLAFFVDGGGSLLAISSTGEPVVLADVQRSAAPVARAAGAGFDTSGDPSVAAAARVVHEVSLDAYWAAMIGLSLGSVLFCRALFRARLVREPWLRRASSGVRCSRPAARSSSSITASGSSSARTAGCSRRLWACCWSSRASLRCSTRTCQQPRHLCRPGACALPHRRDRRQGRRSALTTLPRATTEAVPNPVELRGRPDVSGNVHEVILHDGSDSFANLALNRGA